MLKFRKSLFFAMMAFLLFSYNTCYAQEDRINIYENGRMLIELENKPFLMDNVLYIPLREMMNHYGTGQLKYESPNIIIIQDTEYDGKARIVLTSGSNIIEVNGILAEMNDPPIQKDGCVYVSTEYLPLINMGRSFFINFEQIDDTLNVYLRNDTLGKEQINWTNKTFNIESLSEKTKNTVELSEKDVPINFTWEFSFQTVKQSVFMDNNKDTYLTDYITSNNRCKFYEDDKVQAVTVPFNQNYEITFIYGDEINDEVVNHIYKYRDSKIKATSISIPIFTIQDENSTYILNENGFFQEGTVSDQRPKEIYLPVNSAVDYMFYKPFYFIISDKEVSAILYKGWVGYVEGEEQTPLMENLDIVINLYEDTILVNGIEKKLRVPAFISRNGYIMLPIREITEVFPDIEVLWNNNCKEAEIFYGQDCISIVSGADEMYINGKASTLKNAAEIQDGRMFVSLRDMCRICAISDEEVQWDNTTKTATIHTEVNK